MNLNRKLLVAVLFFLTLFYGCSKSEGEVEENIPVAEENEITITNEQFEMAGMAFGKLSNQTFYNKIAATGMVDVPPSEKAYVSLYYGGTVKEINLLIGEAVKKGEVLFTLESPQFIKMQQEYLTVKRELDFLKSEYDRKDKLLKEKIASQKDFAKSEADYYKVLAEFEGLKKELALINVDYNNLDAQSISSIVKILSPISGSVTEVNVVNGQHLDPNQTAVSIINSNHMHLELKVFEKDITNLKVGQKINFASQGFSSKVYNAEVLVVGKSIHPNDRSIDIHAHIKEGEGDNLVPGMFVNAEILADGSSSNALPADAVVKVEGQYYVFVKESSNADGYSLAKKEVYIGNQSDSFVQILNADQFAGNTEFLVKGSFDLIN